MSEYKHISVLLAPTIELLAPAPGAIMVDGTVGLGGHSEAILQRIRPDGILFGIDRDRNALAMAKKRLSEGFLPIHGNFFDLKTLLAENGVQAVDGIVMDLGVSSYQLDEPSRGFSYMADAPLDMRMDETQPYSAKDAVNTLSEEELRRIIQEYGEERWAKRIAQFIVQKRQLMPVETTRQLVEIIKAAIPASARREGPHPAKRTFQALRIHVNGELDGLGQALEDAVHCLKPGGRLCVITFHSLEDRIVKQTFQRLQNPCTCPPHSPVCTCGKRAEVEILTRKPIVPDAQELNENPRSRSAKLRAVRRLAF